MATYAMPKLATNSANAKKREAQGPRNDKADAQYVRDFVAKGAPPVRILIIGPDGETQDAEITPYVAKAGTLGWRGRAAGFVDGGHGKRFKVTFDVSGWVPGSKKLAQGLGIGTPAGDTEGGEGGDESDEI